MENLIPLSNDAVNHVIELQKYAGVKKRASSSEIRPSQTLFIRNMSRFLLALDPGHTVKNMYFFQEFQIKQDLFHHETVGLASTEQRYSNTIGIIPRVCDKQAGNQINKIINNSEDHTTTDILIEQYQKTRRAGRCNSKDPSIKIILQLEQANGRFQNLSNDITYNSATPISHSLISLSQHPRNNKFYEANLTANHCNVFQKNQIQNKYLKMMPCTSEKKRFKEHSKLSISNPPTKRKKYITKRCYSLNITNKRYLNQRDNGHDWNQINEKANLCPFLLENCQSLVKYNNNKSLQMLQATFHSCLQQSNNHSKELNEFIIKDDFNDSRSTISSNNSDSVENLDCTDIYKQNKSSKSNAILKKGYDNFSQYQLENDQVSVLNTQHLSKNKKSSVNSVFSGPTTKNGDCNKQNVNQLAESNSNLLVSIIPNNQLKYYMPSLKMAFDRVCPGPNDALLQSYKKHYYQTFRSLQYCKFLDSINIDMLSTTQHILYRLPKNNNKRTIVFDLDETLVHCQGLSTTKGDIHLPIKFPDESVKYVKLKIAGISIRPYAVECLEELSKYFEIIIFTAAHQYYANPVVDYLDPKKEYISHCLFRDSCIQTEDGIFIKDLRALYPRKLKDILIIDNSAYSFGFQIDNGIPCIPFYNDKNDEELKHFIPYAQHLLAQEDMIAFNREYFKLYSYTQASSVDLLQKNLFP